MKQLAYFAIVVSFIGVAPAGAAILYVPSQYGDIQSAANAAGNGDVVEVAAGTFTGAGNREITFPGRNLTIRSASGPGATTLDLQNQGRAFYLDSSQTSATLIQGFTIRNGQATNGAGSGIGYWGGAATIRNCDFQSCGSMGGLSEGGAIRIGGPASPLIEGCTFTGCTADFGGGICPINQASPTIRDCDFNSCGGAGIYMWDQCNVTIESCRFLGNTESPSSFAAGVAVFQNCQSTLTNCFMDGGTTTWGGAGIHANGGGFTAKHCTLTGNTGGVLIQNTASTMVNCILWNNSGQQIETVAGSLSITYSCIQGGWAGTGNFQTSPGLISSGDYHLGGSSGCIDAGTNAGVSVDIEGDPRPEGSGYDVGCDEIAGAATTIDASLTMPASHFTAGATCGLELRLSNSGGSASGMPVFVILDVGGFYFFHPSWRELSQGPDYLIRTIPGGSTTETIIPTFPWPAGTGSASGLQFLAAVTNPAMTQIMGALGSWSFSFSS